MDETPERPGYSRHRRGILIAAILLVAAFAWLGLRTPVERARDFYRAIYFPVGGSVLSLFENPFKRWGVIGAGVYELQPGVSIYLDPADFIGNFALRAGDWEKFEWDWITPYLPAGGVFVDVGAHVGTYSLKAAKAIGEHGRVIAIEPNPATAAHLRQGIAASRRGNVTVVEAACGEQRSRMKLFTSTAINTGMTSFSSENASHTVVPYSSVEVDVIPLDDILSPLNLQRVDVLKVDTEGAETMVLRSARASVARFHPIIVVETVESQLQELHSSLQELEDLLRSYGYQKTKTTVYNALWIPAR